MKFLRGLYFKDLFVVVGFLCVFFFKIALGFLEVPLDFGEFIIPDLKHGIEGMVSDGFEAGFGYVLFPPFEVSV